MSPHSALFLACVALVIGLNVEQVTSWGLRQLLEGYIDNENDSTNTPDEIFGVTSSSYDDSYHYEAEEQLGGGVTESSISDDGRPSEATGQPIQAVMIGCYRDSRDRAMSGDFYYDYDSMTPDGCRRYCFNERYRYAGTQNRGECYCGDSYDQYGPADNCNHPCGGDRTKMCGGDWALSVMNTGYDGPAREEPQSRIQSRIACSSSSRPARITDASGSIVSPNYPQNYGDSASCQWLITSPSENGVLSLSFTDFTTESCCDHVYVYNGGNSDAPLLGQVSGTSGGSTFTTTQREMFVVFRSDGSVTRSGFKANYWAPVDNPGSPANYTVTATISNSQLNVTDYAVYITLYGVSGTSLELLLDNSDESKIEHGQSRFVFPDVSSVGILHCVDIRLTSATGNPSLYLDTVRIESDTGNDGFFNLRRYYGVDSTMWSPKHGCGTKYSVSILTGNQGGAESTAKKFITLIGEAGNSAEQMIGYQYESYFSRGSYNSFNFDLPQLDKVSCINLRRDDFGDNPSWFVTHVEITSPSGKSVINVNRWIPSISSVPRGIVVCTNESNLCLDNLDASCPKPSTWRQLAALSNRQLIQHFVDTDMFDLCPQIQDYTQCALAFLELNKNCPQNDQLGRSEALALQMTSVIAEQFCGRYIGVVNCHKDCMLKVDEDGNLILPHEVVKQCKRFITAESDGNTPFPPLCQSHEFVHCAKNVVSKQCGSNIADVAAVLYGELSGQICDSSTKPACPYDFTYSEAGCHKLMTEQYSWYGAQERCNRVESGSHVVFINSNSEQEQIKDILEKNGGANCMDSSNTMAIWTGGRRPSWPPAFRWYFNQTTPSTLACSQDWNSLPSEGDNEACLRIRSYSSSNSGSSGSSSVNWQSADCWHSHCFICEIDLVAP